MHDYDDGDDEILRKIDFIFGLKKMWRKEKKKKKSVKMPVIIGSDWKQLRKKRILIWPCCTMWFTVGKSSIC